MIGPAASGKTTVANRLVASYGYSRASTGPVCRDVAQLLFGSQERSILQSLADAVRAIDQDAWVRAALREAGPAPIVFDSIRYSSDHAFLSELGFLTWAVVARPVTRDLRLIERGESLSQAELSHQSELPIPVRPDFVVDTTDAKSQALTSMIRVGLSKASQRPL